MGSAMQSCYTISRNSGFLSNRLVLVEKPDKIKLKFRKRGKVTKPCLEHTKHEEGHEHHHHHHEHEHHEQHEHHEHHEHGGEVGNLGKNNMIYIYNGCGNDAYVILSENPAWRIVDVVVDVTEFVAGLAKTAVELGDGDEIQGMGDLWKYFKFLKKVAYNGPKEAFKIANMFKEKGIYIKAGEYKQVFFTSTLNPSKWLKPSAWGAMCGAKVITISVTTFFDELKEMHSSEIVHMCRMAQFNTGTDDSWILLMDKVVRSKYGTIYEQDPKAGTEYYETNQADSTP